MFLLRGLFFYLFLPILSSKRDFRSVSYVSRHSGFLYSPQLFLYGTNIRMKVYNIKICITNQLVLRLNNVLYTSLLDSNFHFFEGYTIVKQYCRNSTWMCSNTLNSTILYTSLLDSNFYFFGGYTIVKQYYRDSTWMRSNTLYRTIFR